MKLQLVLILKQILDFIKIAFYPKKRCSIKKVVILQEPFMMEAIIWNSQLETWSLNLMSKYVLIV